MSEKLSSRPSSVKSAKGSGVVDVAVKSASSSFTYDQTHRTLKARHIQLIGIGGTIGTALFVQIGASLTKGGPASLFIAFTVWCTFVMAVSNCLSEMVTWIPISSPFVRFADRFVDPALGFAAGINFFVFEAAMIPYEIVAFTVVLQFWTDQIPVVGAIFFVLFFYSVLNIFAVRFYGESEFWLALGKMLLAILVIVFTFFTMLGANPLHDRYGFRYWNPSNIEGAPFAEFYTTGDTGRFLGFVACLVQASFTIAGPDYISMTAGEAENPRKVLPRSFNSVFYRLATFFILGSLCVGIVVPYNDENLLNALSAAKPGAGSSPYVIAMQRMKIPVLPHIVNAGVLSAIFSAGNSYVYCASRTLFGLALEGKAPKFFTRCTRQGVPIYSVVFTLAIALLAFLQVSNNSAVVLQWFINLVTASQLLNFAFIAFTYLRFYYAMKAQGIDRSTLPHRSFWQPFCAYYSLIGCSVMALVGGYTVFLNGNWNIPNFLFSYMMIGVCPVLYVGWKLWHKTPFRALHEVTFFETEREQVDQYEENFVPEIPSSRLLRAWNWLFT
ncbi:general amino acid permease AGP2 [Cylindrobasidium torrendii FP15055 ss-10]|uniref:General amino acid permease AGP2 n=1 Tax=Cylindrobasidium torrendii FP15055 ss-10 TaxID=1314674 RepID=A0A0D7B3Z2_9AGAR|nr:general amino acid permease AGP2 [Cylindrobasidium torrendii FP15055 ss-10]